MTRRRAIRKYYLWLYCGSRSGVRNCPMTGHPLWPYRLGRLVKLDSTQTSEPDPVTGMDYRIDAPLQQAKAIRATCLGCAETPSRVRQCSFYDCFLWPYRSGRHQKRSGGGTSGTNAVQAGNHVPKNATTPKTAVSGDSERSCHAS